MSLPSSYTTTYIPGTACMGDSRETINTNFNSLYNGLSAVWGYVDTVSGQQDNMTFIGSISAANITLTNNGSLQGATSATYINIGALSARSFDLIHMPANDGVDPILNIGETGTQGFSGFRVRYEELTNRLIGSSRTGATILTSVIINTATGQVGISGAPAAGQALTVSGNVSATGNVFNRYGISNITASTPINFLTTASAPYSAIFTVPTGYSYLHGVTYVVLDAIVGGPHTTDTMPVLFVINQLTTSATARITDIFTLSAAGSLATNRMYARTVN